MGQATVILIPSYEPTERLVEFVHGLQKVGFEHILVVNDGSADCFKPFYEAAITAGAEVIGYAQNHGKGHALKFGFEYIQTHFPQIKHVLTADSDGQHTPEDCLKMQAALDDEAAKNDDIVGKLILGCRDFSKKIVPFRSWFGNRWTSFWFWTVYRHWLPDTQTGLRAFPVKMIPLLNSIAGDGFEYEMAMLGRCIKSGVKLQFVKVNTIYENGNASSHFEPWNDTVRIYKAMWRARHAHCPPPSSNP